jgi:hypothetical protein
VKSIPRNLCINPVGLEVSSYRVARCAADGVSDTKNESIVVFNNEGRLLFSIAGYELIPKENETEFVLISDIQNQIIIFNGDWACYLLKSQMPSSSIGVSKIANKFYINYAIETIENCWTGHYSYVGKNKNIELSGYKSENVYYLMEMGRNLISNGLFVLDRIDGGTHGLWIGVPTKIRLTVDQ